MTRFMKTRRISVAVAIVSIGGAPLSGGSARDYVDARAAFLERQATLVKLAGVVGALHHLRDICFPDEIPQKWRNRMKEMIALEYPIEDTQQRMIAAFNARYQEMKRRFSRCSADIDAENDRLAREGAGYARRLRADFAIDAGALQAPVRTAQPSGYRAGSEGESADADPATIPSRTAVTRERNGVHSEKVESFQ